MAVVESGRYPALTEIWNESGLSLSTYVQRNRAFIDTYIKGPHAEHWGVGVGAYALTIVQGLYFTLVLQHLWNWFVVPALHVGEISYLGMLGLKLIVETVIWRRTSSGPELPQVQRRWQTLGLLVQACLPE